MSPPKRLFPLILAAVAFSISLWFLPSTLVFFPDSSSKADSTADWLVTSAALDGFGAYRPTSELAEHYDVDYQIASDDPPGSEKWVHPRLPGAILLQLPVVLLDPVTLFDTAVFLGLLFSFVAGVLLARGLGLRLELVVLAMPILVLTDPMRINASYAGQALWVAALVTTAWYLLRSGDSPYAGILIGMAATLKVFPFFLLIPLVVFGRRRAVTGLVSTVLSLNLAGLLLPGVTFQAALEGITRTGGAWLEHSANGSLPAFLARIGMSSEMALTLSAVALLAGAFAIHKGTADFNRAFFGSALLAVVMSPLSWVSYDVVYLPVVLWIVAQPRVTWRIWLGLCTWAGVVLVESWILRMLGGGYPPHVYGQLLLIGRLALFAVALAIPNQSELGVRPTSRTA